MRDEILPLKWQDVLKTETGRFRSADPVDVKIGLNIPGKIVVSGQCFGKQFSADGPRDGCGESGSLKSTVFEWKTDYPLNAELSEMKSAWLWLI